MKQVFLKPILLLVSIFLFMQSDLYAQGGTTVSGTVVSAEDGSPIPYASVVATGTTTMTMTLDDGSFILKVPEGSVTLTVSSFGYKTVEIPVSSQKMTIKMSVESENLDAVMIVAYGTAKKGTYTGSASVVDSDVLAAKPLTHVAQALTGTTAGMQVGTSNGQPGSDPTSESGAWAHSMPATALS